MAVRRSFFKVGKKVKNLEAGYCSKITKQDISLENNK